MLSDLRRARDSNIGGDRRWRSRGLTTFEQLVLLALASIAIGVAYIAFREPAGSRVLREADRQLEESRSPEHLRALAARTDVSSLAQAIKLYKIDNGHYPTAAQGLDSLVRKPVAETDLKNWRAYLDKVPSDPWGRSYQYVNPGLRADIEVFSLGPDGVSGTSDDIGQPD